MDLTSGKSLKKNLKIKKVENGVTKNPFDGGNSSKINRLVGEGHSEDSTGVYILSQKLVKHIL